MHARAVTLGDVQAVDSLRRRMQRGGPLQARHRDRRAVHARGGDRAVPPRQRGPQPPGHDGRGRHLPVEPRLPAPQPAARGGHLLGPDGAPGVLRRLPDEELDHAVRRHDPAALLGRPLHRRKAAARNPGDPRRQPRADSRHGGGLRRLQRRSLAHLPVRPARAGRAARCGVARCCRRSCARRPNGPSATASSAPGRRSRTSACASPPSCRSSWPTASARWWCRPGPFRAPSTRATRRAPARRSRRSRRRGGRRCRRCARSSACCAARATAPSSLRSRDSRASRRSWSEPEAAAWT